MLWQLRSVHKAAEPRPKLSHCSASLCPAIIPAVIAASVSFALSLALSVGNLRGLVCRRWTNGFFQDPQRGLQAQYNAVPFCPSVLKRSVRRGLAFAPA